MTIHALAIPVHTPAFQIRINMTDGTAVTLSSTHGNLTSKGYSKELTGPAAECAQRVCDALTKWHKSPTKIDEDEPEIRTGLLAKAKATFVKADPTLKSHPAFGEAAQDLIKLVNSLKVQGKKIKSIKAELVPLQNVTVRHNDRKYVIREAKMAESYDLSRTEGDRKESVERALAKRRISILKERATQAAPAVQQDPILPLPGSSVAAQNESLCGKVALVVASILFAVMVERLVITQH